MRRELRAAGKLWVALWLATWVPAALVSQAAHAENSLEKGWKSFYVNDRQQARASFTDATKEPATKAEAYLALSLLATIDKTSDEAFKAYQQFFQATENPYPHTLALWTTGAVKSNGKQNPAQLAFLRQLAQDTKADGTIRALAREAIGYHYQLSARLDESLKEYKQLGTIDNWQVVGEFENISGSGFDKDYGPLALKDPRSTFTNKRGAEVSWFDLPAIRNDKWVDFTYYFYYSNSIVYAQTYVFSPADQEVEFRAGVSGSLKAWVNDVLVLSEAQERNNDLDTYIRKVKLRKGYNRVLMQAGESEAGRLNFMLRLTDAHGNPVPGLTCTTIPQAYTPETPYTAAEVPVLAEAYFEDQVKKQPQKLINYLLLAQAYLRNDRTYEARKVLLQAQQLAPACSYIRTRLIEVYAREGNRTDLAAGLEWLKDHDARNPISMTLLFNDEIEKENYDNAQAILTQLEGVYGSTNQDILTKKLELLSKQKKQEDMLRLIEQAYSLYPDNYTFMQLKMLVERDVKHNNLLAFNILKKYLKSNYSTDAMEALAGNYFKRGDVLNGVKTYEQMLAYSPVSVGFCKTLAEIYFQMQQYGKSEEMYRRALKLAPYVGAFWSGLANVYSQQKKDDLARDAYKKAIVFEPTDYQSRKALRKMENKKDIFEYFEQQDVYAVCKNAPAASAYPDDNSVILIDEVQKVVYSGGASEEKHVLVVKVFNTQGIEDWKEYQIGFHNMQRYLIEKAEVVKGNGSKVPAEVNENHIVFTTLEAGDAIHITYRLENYLLGKLAPHFWDKFYFSHAYPYTAARYSLLIAPEVKFQYKVTQQDIRPKVSKADGFDLYVWEQKDRQNLRYEDKMPVLADVGQILYLSSFPDWKFISNWYHDLAATKAKTDFEVKETVANLFKDKQGLSEQAKVKEIYNFIISNIRYSSVSFRQSGLIPQKASAVLNTRIGDCKDVSTLFVAMCKEVGIKAELVLVNTRDNGRNDMVLPSIDFNHCIAKVHVGEQEYFVELTSNYLPFASLYGYMLNSLILEVKDEKDGAAPALTFLNPKTRFPNVILRSTEISVQDNDLIINKKNVKTAAQAAGMKQTYRDLGTKEKEKNMLNAINGEYPSISLNLLEFKGLEGPTDTVQYRYAYTANDAITQVGGLSLIALPWASKASSRDFVFNDDRKFPMELWQIVDHDRDKEEIILNLPARRLLAEVPKTISYSCSVAEYSLSFKYMNGKLTAVREFRYKQDSIPVDKIQEFREFYKKVIAADTKPIALKNMQ